VKHADGKFDISRDFFKGSDLKIKKPVILTISRANNPWILNQGLTTRGLKIMIPVIVSTPVILYNFTGSVTPWFDFTAYYPVVEKYKLP